MTEFFCKEHNTVWFMKGKMKGYAHPIKDEEGKNTGEWCNMPSPSDAEEVKPEKKDHLVEEAKRLGAVEIPPEASPVMTKNDWAAKDRATRKSIERQTALNVAIKMGEILTNAEIEVFKINKTTGQLTLKAEKIIATAKLFEKYLETGA